MASTGKCRYCGATLTSDEKECRNCGAGNPDYVPPLEIKDEESGTPRIVHPKTIAELKQYCAERGMPLLRMRFFIDTDTPEAKAFGIYRDGDDFIVYKNKADGSRAVRYHGKDEAYAVNELFQKLLDECHMRGIYPDGKPKSVTRGRAGQTRADKKKTSLISVVIVIAILVISLIISYNSHKKDGYYRFPGDRTYYRYDDDWFLYEPYIFGNSWTAVDSPSYSDYDSYYEGNSYDSDWGVENFKNSDTWSDYSESHSYSDSSDYSSWDSGGTDWSSDW
ncbi:MAG: hypothetical protein IKH18_10240 [Clostridia bacterium]|nr:hypothetical protein [Clostridia bacterium]